MDVNSNIEVVYSGKSDTPPDSKSLGKPGRMAVGAQTTTAKSPGSVKTTIHHIFSAHPTILSTRSG